MTRPQSLFATVLTALAMFVGIVLMLGLGSKQPTSAAENIASQLPPGLTTAEWQQIERQLSGGLEQLRLSGDDAQVNDYFGISVAISGDTVVVGAQGEDGGLGDPLDGAGAAYVFSRNQGGANVWGQVAKLTASDAQSGDAFGRSVAISGDTIVVGAEWEDGGPGDPLDRAGAAYVFGRDQDSVNTWNQVAKLTAGDAQAGDLFGWSVAVSGDTVVVGAFLEDGGPGDPLLGAGAAYVFDRNQGGANVWGQVAKLTASDAQSGDLFGVSVAISDDTVVIGAQFGDSGLGDPSDREGAAYVFSRNQGGANVWGQVAKLTADDGQPSDEFGVSVAISSDTVVVGASGEDGGPGDPVDGAGAAYVFGRNQGGDDTWGQTAKLTAGDAQPDDWFGYSVTISGDTIVVGAHGEDGGPGDPLPGSGSAYVFGRNQGGAGTWGQAAKLTAGDAQASDWFGWSVAISSDTIVVGAWLEDGGPGDPLPQTGSAYVFVNPTILTIAKDGPALVEPGDLITYSLHMRNGLPVTLTSLVITDAIPLGATYIGGGTLVGNVVSWTVNSLASGQTITRQFVVTATTTVTNSDYRVTASEGFTATGLFPVVTGMVTDRSYMPAVRKP